MPSSNHPPSRRESCNTLCLAKNPDSSLCTHLSAPLSLSLLLLRSLHILKVTPRVSPVNDAHLVSVARSDILSKKSLQSFHLKGKHIHEGTWRSLDPLIVPRTRGRNGPLTLSLASFCVCMLFFDRSQSRLFESLILAKQFFFLLPLRNPVSQIQFHGHWACHS